MLVTALDAHPDDELTLEYSRASLLTNTSGKWILQGMEVMEVEHNQRFALKLVYVLTTEAMAHSKRHVSASADVGVT